MQHGRIAENSFRSCLQQCRAAVSDNLSENLGRVFLLFEFPMFYHVSQNSTFHLTNPHFTEYKTQAAETVKPCVISRQLN